MKRSKKILAVSAAVSLLFCVYGSSKKNDDPHRHGFKIQKGKIEYSGGTIYLGSKDKIEAMEAPNNGDILVIDDRDAPDPNYRVMNSNKIVNFDLREEVIDALLCYEEKYPSDWDRTKRSMTNEWVAHNVMSIFHYKTYRTNHVDFNNADEKTYKLSLK